MFRKLLKYVFLKINFILLKFNFSIKRIKEPVKRSGLNLNIGSGGYEINGFINLDYYSKHYYPNGKFNLTHYDMRADDIPFKKSEVDVIYCAHVIEHIETEFVEKFFVESKRVLKNKGVLRIACPDSFFLYKQLINHPEYFSWHPMYNNSQNNIECFIDEVGTHNLKLNNYGLEKKIHEYDYETLLKELRKNGNFDSKNPDYHINNWDFKRIEKLGKKVGFKKIIKSRHQGSFCPTLQGHDMDLTSPVISLYVDLSN